ncbi:unnamed protein product [Allacma fusca]|uniref:Uncharacterized protein n=1 Tax=Allacma fusca TaxID=39272 RepID=A0A8J2L4L9_9HEXA|nr:unnamed protein product [Allacma fusca]
MKCEQGGQNPQSRNSLWHYYSKGNDENMGWLYLSGVVCVSVFSPKARLILVLYRGFASHVNTFRYTIERFSGIDILGNMQHSTSYSAFLYAPVIILYSTRHIKTLDFLRFVLNLIIFPPIKIRVDNGNNYWQLLGELEVLKNTGNLLLKFLVMNVMLGFGSA